MNWSLKKCIELIKEKVLLMGATEWKKLCQKVKSKQFIIRVEESSDDSVSDD